MSEQIRSFIGGRWRDGHGDRKIRIVNPAFSTEVLWEGVEATITDADEAVRSAVSAFPRWRQTSAARRSSLLQGAANWLQQNVDLVADDLSREQGKTRAESNREVESTIRSLQFFAGQAQEPVGDLLPRSETTGVIWAERIPLGPVVCITPWNFPLLIPAYKLGPAIAFGNTAVLKPASNTPRSAMHLVTAFQESGCPDGVINLIVGSGSTVGNALVGHPEVRAITFTGSNDVGTALARNVAGRLVRLQMELGGKNPALVFEDADVDQAVNLTVMGAMGMAGQRCTATSRVIALDGIYPAMEDALADRLTAIRLGNPLDPKIDMGPLVSADHRQNVLASIDSGQSHGRLIVGGQAASGSAVESGFFVEPTLFGEVDPDSPLAQEEIFGPVISLIRAHSAEDLIELANRTRFGLAASIFTKDLGLAMSAIEDLEVGMVHVNSQPSAIERYVPFGGTKASGFGGREQGRGAREFFTEWKSVYINW